MVRYGCGRLVLKLHAWLVRVVIYWVVLTNLWSASYYQLLYTLVDLLSYRFGSGTADRSPSISSEI